MQITDNQLELYDGFTLDHEGKRVTITADDNQDSPRDWDNLGIMVCIHRRYNLGDQNLTLTNREYQSIVEESGWDGLQEAIELNEKPLVILPLFLYDHSGITMYTSGSKDYKGYLQHERWDSGQVGFIYTTEEQLKKMGTETRDKAKLEEYLRGEIETYDQYLRGEVYRYTVSDIEVCDHGHEHEEVIDDCGGFFDKESILEAINQNFPIKVAVQEAK